MLRVQGAYLENGADFYHVSSELADELAVAAEWLGLGGVQVMPRGDLAPELAKAVLRG